MDDKGQVRRLVKVNGNWHALPQFINWGWHTRSRCSERKFLIKKTLVLPTDAKKTTWEYSQQIHVHVIMVWRCIFVLPDDLFFQLVPMTKPCELPLDALDVGMSYCFYCAFCICLACDWMLLFTQLQSIKTATPKLCVNTFYPKRMKRIKEVHVLSHCTVLR